MASVTITMPGLEIKRTVTSSIDHEWKSLVKALVQTLNGLDKANPCSTAGYRGRRLRQQIIDELETLNKNEEAAEI